MAGGASEGLNRHFNGRIEQSCGLVNNLDIKKILNYCRKVEPELKVNSSLFHTSVDNGVHFGNPSASVLLVLVHFQKELSFLITIFTCP